MNMNPAATDQKRDIRALINSDAVKNQLAMVLPKHMTADRMARVAITAILKTPKLMQCKPESLLQALMLCSQTGLEPDGRNAHLIPYGDTVQVIFDYKGLVALAERNGVKNIRAVAVCDNDEFNFEIKDGRPTVSHKIDWKRPRGNAYVFYGTCLRNDELDVEVMHKDDIDAIRRRSKASGSGPWVTDYEEMAKKTVLRRMSKRWDISPEAFDGINQDYDTPADIQRPPTKAVILSPIALPEAPEAAQEASQSPTTSEPKPVAKTPETTPSASLEPQAEPLLQEQAPEPSQEAQKPLEPASEPPSDPAECVKIIEANCARDGVTANQVLKFLYSVKVADSAKHKELGELSTAKLQRVVVKWADTLEKIKAIQA